MFCQVSRFTETIMKKELLKYFYTTITLLFVSFAFTSCSDDDDDNGSLYGYWANYDEDIYFGLNKDHSFWMEEDGYDCYGEYSVKSNTITITDVEYDNGVGVEAGDKLQFSLSGNTLVLSVDGGKMTFKRIKEDDFDDYDW